MNCYHGKSKSTHLYNENSRKGILVMGNIKTDDEDVIPKRRSAKILEALDDLENEEVVLVSNYKRKDEPKQEEIEESSSYTDEEWMNTLAALKKPKCRKKNISSLFDGTDYECSKPKKKKKKKKGDLTDYNEMFDKEIRLIQNQLQDQSKFVQSLQRRYDAMDSQKSTARGVGKFTTDLIGVLNSARALNKDLIRELVSTKKTIAELSMKEKKEFGVGTDVTDDSGQFASSYLKQIMAMKKDAFEGGEFGVDDITSDDDLFDAVSSTIINSEQEQRSDESRRYLKYETQNVQVRLVYDTATENKYFIAENDDGEIIDDYPLPTTADSCSVNRSTGIAVDKYGKKYHVIFQ